MDEHETKPAMSVNSTPAPSIVTSAAPSTFTPISLETAFSTLQTHPTEHARAAERGAQMLLKDWQVFVTKTKHSDLSLLTDSPSGNLAALCFPLVQDPTEMENIAYVLEYCLRQNEVARESKLAMDATAEALSKGESCNDDTKRITHMRGLHRIQLIVADRAQLTRLQLNRGQRFFDRDQAIALVELSTGIPVRPDRVLRIVVRMFRLNTGMPNAQAWQEAWEGCVRSMVLTGNILTADNEERDDRRADGKQQPFFKKLMVRLRSGSRSGREKLRSVTGSVSGRVSAVQDLEGTNGRFAAAKEKLAVRWREAEDEDGRTVVLLDKWEAMVMGHYVWGKDATVYKDWVGPKEIVPAVSGRLGHANRRSVMLSLQSTAGLMSSLPSPVSLGHGDARSLRRLSKASRTMLNDEF